jgi:hypothetical protein
MKLITTILVTSVGVTLIAGCSGSDKRIGAEQIEQDYGVAGGVEKTIATADGSLKGTLVPITLADGSAGHLFIPQKVSKDTEAVYVQDEQVTCPQNSLRG